LRSSPTLTDRLSDLILIGVKYHRAEMLEVHDDAHVLLNHTQTVSTPKGKNHTLLITTPSGSTDHIQMMAIADG
jgi:hypothetical protein